MKKKIELFVIYGKNQKGESLRTKIAFAKENEAKDYCEYLNRPDNYPGAFTYKKETTVVYRTANDLVRDPDEDSKLFQEGIEA